MIPRMKKGFVQFTRVHVNDMCGGRVFWCLHTLASSRLNTMANVKSRICNDYGRGDLIAYCTAFACRYVCYFGPALHCNCTRIWLVVNEFRIAGTVARIPNWKLSLCKMCWALQSRNFNCMLESSLEKYSSICILRCAWPCSVWPLMGRKPLGVAIREFLGPIVVELHADWLSWLLHADWAVRVGSIRYFAGRLVWNLVLSHINRAGVFIHVYVPELHKKLLHPLCVCCSITCQSPWCGMWW